jgi:hypothetical protein
MNEVIEYIEVSLQASQNYTIDRDHDTERRVEPAIVAGEGAIAHRFEQAQIAKIANRSQKKCCGDTPDTNPQEPIGQAEAQDAEASE